MLCTPLQFHCPNRICPVGPIGPQSPLTLFLGTPLPSSVHRGFKLGPAHGRRWWKRGKLEFRKEGEGQDFSSLLYVGRCRQAVGLLCDPRSLSLAPVPSGSSSSSSLLTDLFLPLPLQPWLHRVPTDADEWVASLPITVTGLHWTLVRGSVFLGPDR